MTTLWGARNEHNLPEFHLFESAFHNKTPYLAVCKNTPNAPKNKELSYCWVWGISLRNWVRVFYIQTIKQPHIDLLKSPVFLHFRKHKMTLIAGCRAYYRLTHNKMFNTVYRGLILALKIWYTGVIPEVVKNASRFERTSGMISCGFGANRHISVKLYNHLYDIRIRTRHVCGVITYK